ncbi:MAG: PQQ-binding-like beta-propeller repeat protein [Acidobacteria bacterium]|nr:PQQ-binding-like beta-propeller repeat protein [Acidobacteriota bacterium]
MIRTALAPRQPPRALRLRPGIVIVTLLWSTWIGLPLLVPEAAPIAMVGALLGGVGVLAWWAFFSGAAPIERWGAPLLMLGVSLATVPLLDVSISSSMMGLMFPVYTAPGLSLVFVAWAVATRRMADRPRRVALVAAIVLASGFWTTLRTDGMTGDSRQALTWRWTETAEARLLATTAAERLAPPPKATSDANDANDADWPGFRGRNRDGVVRGIRIRTDWDTLPPEELWRRPVGPGVGSFSVRGRQVFTQEQRGDREVVSSYLLATGEPVWRHADPVRFWDSHAGAGPRGTPTVAGDRLYTLGGTGLLTALDAQTGRRLWGRDVAAEHDAFSSGWGFAGSPLVVDDVVIVAAIGTLAAYDAETGAPRWSVPDGADSYSSPHLATLDGVPQVLLLTSDGVTSVAPADGRVLWTHDWATASRIVQPALTAGGDILVGAGGFAGMQRVSATRAAGQHGGWTTEVRWTTRGLKPYFNDFVVHEGHAYGFDGSILASVDLETGERAWKGGRYGHGQLLLLADQDLLLVLGERGDLALVDATPTGFSERARAPAIEGKTWNHPVLVDDVLLVRNTEEMAAFRLSRQ